MLKRLGAFSLLIGASLVGITGIPLTLIPPHWPGFGLLGAATILITGAIILGFRRPNTPNRTH